MSKERAVRRAERERVAAQRAVEQQAERERQRRRTARRARLTGWLPRPAASPSGTPGGIIAERRRGRIRMVVAGLVLVQVLVWIARGDWPSRLGALLVALLLLPLLIAFTA